MFSKILVANRGEIAVRAFRAATELGAKTVAVFPYEDRKSEHVLKADEAYQIGEEGHPVRAYLDPEAIVRTAVEAGADAIYPGYGFLSENPVLAEACANAGVTFVGPPASVAAPDRQQVARHRGGQAGRACPPSRAPSRAPTSTPSSRRPRRSASRSSPRRSPAVAGAACVGSSDARTCASRSRRCMREAESAFGDPTSSSSRPWSARGTSRCRSSPTPRATCIHLFERDCSVQRRHQKVVEIAPAPNLDPELRERMCAHAVALRRGDRLRQRGHGRVPARAPTAATSSSR